MSRLLHAAARGARIQTWVSDFSGWAEERRVAISNADQEWVRIHPEDAHFQYGPISTELRNYALGLPLNGTCWFARLALHNDGDLRTLPPFDRFIFLLLMAEALADEGM